MSLASVPATVVITTKNRKDLLRRALHSVTSQTARPELLVIDDGSTDGTSDMVRLEFPEARLDRVETSLGLIAQRNRGINLASGRIVFSLDDDALYSTDRIVEQTLADFDHPRVGAVAIPCLEMTTGERLGYAAPDEDARWVCESFYGAAHAVRRDLFLRLGGYHNYFFHQAEERDYCLRMLNAGCVVRIGRAEPIHHFEPSGKNFAKIGFYSARNRMLYIWYNVPQPYFLPHVGSTSLRLLSYGFRTGHFLPCLRGVFKGYVGWAHEWQQRRPVSRRTFRASRRLLGCRLIRLDELDSDLEPVGALGSADSAP